MMKRTFLLLGLMCLLSGVVSAQIATTGKITGVATDSSGAVVPNAMVTVKSTALLVPRNIDTGADGAYLLDLLPPGTYEVTVVIKGFRTFTETG
ncbi:MAG TPA: carboxypeptidase-like regulatory domain-containing protein, partial [Candidatus Acidoferrum sp.]|nr:carboxypeptidase-like regulatory domain-containing protein [Candidatus Acidoferrum sp.]